MTRSEVVERIARERRVETMVCNIARRPLSADLKDLCQMIYVALLTYDETKILDLWEHNEIDYFIARIVINQYRSSDSTFRDTFRRPSIRSVDITGLDFPDPSTL